MFGLPRLGMPAMPAVQEFNNFYTVYPVAAAGKDHLEGGDKIILPQSALQQLALLKINYPMTFAIINPSTGKQTHCSVLEFSAEEGVAYVPYWMMQNLFVESGRKVRVQYKKMPKASFVKLQPHETRFTQLSNPKAYLEMCLRMYSCLTEGDAIKIVVDDDSYYFDVLEVKADSDPNTTAVCIIETDVNVEFAPPKDEHKVANSPLGSPAAASPIQKTVVESDDIVITGQTDMQSPSGADPTSPSSSSYFARLSSPGYSLKSGKKKKKKKKKSGATPKAEEQAPPAATPERVVKDEGRFRYIYEKDGSSGKLRLIRRLPKPATSKQQQPSQKGASDSKKFSPFSGKGYSLS